jgi:GT2 family glycosyltransferase
MSSRSGTLTASIVIPTRMRPRYLEVALASIAPQLSNVPAELIVVDDDKPSTTIRELCERYGARYVPHDRPLGLNAARNTGIERSTGELLVFVDDDVEVSDRWLGALLLAAEEHPDVDVFAGPIIPRLEGSPPHACGREDAPITSLDLGGSDTRAAFAWGANMTIRRSAIDRVGPFDVTLPVGGDEQEWQERLLAREGAVTATGSPKILYVANAALDHRRSPADARLRSLCRAAHGRGRAARRFDAWRGVAPSLGRELITLLACAGHVVRRRCPAGLTMVAHSAGRLEEGLRAAASPAGSRTGRATDAPATVERGSPTGEPTSNGHLPDDFLSGESGTVGGLDGKRRAGTDIAFDALLLASGQRRRVDRAARRSPPTRRVLVLGIERPERHDLALRIRAELERSRHEVELCFSPPADRGKFQNLNLLLDQHPSGDRDWLLVVDDDIELPRGFLDRFLLLAEHFRFDLAQPAHRLTSHAAWRVTRRQPGSLARETRFVEIGPVTAFAHSTFSTLLPFPDLRMGWGLDVHWAALAREHGWHCGVIDAVAINHRIAPAASAYSREQALAEARSFLACRPYLSASEAQQTLITHRRL